MYNNNKNNKNEELQKLCGETSRRSGYDTIVNIYIFTLLISNSLSQKRIRF